MSGFEAYRDFVVNSLPNLADCVDIHFANACQPDSPFAPHLRERLAASLQEMLAEAKTVHPTAKT